jgi:hypothetical protein
MVDHHADYTPTRKDIATSHTHKLVIRDIPELAIPRSYQAVKEVEIHAHSLNWPFELDGNEEAAKCTEWMEDQVRKCLKSITSPNSSADSLHVKLYNDPEYKREYEVLGRLLEQFESAVPVTFEFFGFDFLVDYSMIVDQDMICPLHMAYELQAVVNFEIGGASHPSSVAKCLSMAIGECFENEDIDSPVGQVYMCGLPPLILEPNQLVSAHDINEAALIKLYKLVTVWPNLRGSQYKTNLDFFRSRIKLVEPGFRPSLADLYPRPQPT